MIAGEGTPEGEARAAARATRLKRWLVASLALNFLVVGAVAGSFAVMKRHHGSWRGGGVAGDGYSLFGFSRSLGPERGRAIRRDLLAIRKELKPLREAYRTARIEPADVLAAEPFDRERLRSAFAAVDTAEGRVKETGRARLIDMLASLSAEERKSLSHWWKARMSTRFTRRDREAGKDAETGQTEKP